MRPKQRFHVECRGNKKAPTLKEILESRGHHPPMAAVHGEPHRLIIRILALTVPTTNRSSLTVSTFHHSAVRRCEGSCRFRAPEVPCYSLHRTLGKRLVLSALAAFRSESVNQVVPVSRRPLRLRDAGVSPRGHERSRECNSPLCRCYGSAAARLLSSRFVIESVTAGVPSFRGRSRGCRALAQSAGADCIWQPERSGKASRS